MELIRINFCGLKKIQVWVQVYQYEIKKWRLLETNKKSLAEMTLCVFAFFEKNIMYLLISYFSAFLISIGLLLLSAFHL